MESLNTPGAVMNECDNIMADLNSKILDSLEATDQERQEMEPHLNDVRMTFHGIAARDFKVDFIGLFLTNVLLRALALLRMFSQKDFDVILSNALMGVGVVGWKQEEVEVKDATGN